MAAKSKKQYDLMERIAKGISPPVGTLTKEKAKEFIKGQKREDLPGLSTPRRRGRWGK